MRRINTLPRLLSKAKNENIWCWLSFGTGVIATAVCLYPGFLDFDSFDQLLQARSLSIDPLRPPASIVLTYLWHFTDLILPGPGGIFLINTFFFWIGLFGISVLECKSKLHAALAPLLVASFLPIFLSLAVVGKDLSFISSLLLSASLLNKNERSFDSRYWGGALLALGYSSAMRPNAIFATIPFLFWAAFQWCKRDQARKRSLIQATVVLLSLFLLTIFGANRLAKYPTSGFASRVLLTYDIVGVSARKNVNLLPDFINHAVPALRHDEVLDLYTASSSLPVFWAPPPVRRLPRAQNAEEMSELSSAWRSAVFKYPAAYLAHRTAVFSNLMGFYDLSFQPRWSPEPYWKVRPYYWVTPEEPDFSRHANSGLRRKMMGFVDGHLNSVLFRPWFYLLFFIFASGAMLCSKDAQDKGTKLYLVLMGSVICYQGSYFWIAPGMDFRYSWWLMTVTALLLVLLGLRTVDIWKKSPRRIQG